jgi:hypothetical protein
MASEPTERPHLTVVRNEDEEPANPLHSTAVRHSTPVMPLRPTRDFTERTKVRRAAQLARKIWPGPVGDLVYRELADYAEFGFRFERTSFTERLLQQVLDNDPDRPTPPTPAAQAAA